MIETEKCQPTPVTGLPDTPFRSHSPPKPLDGTPLERSHFETTISVSWISTKERRPRSTTSLKRASWVQPSRHPVDDLGLGLHTHKLNSPFYAPSTDSISTFSVRTRKRETRVSNNFLMQYRRHSHVEITPGAILVSQEVRRTPALPRAVLDPSSRSIARVNTYLKPRLSGDTGSSLNLGAVSEEPLPPKMIDNGFVLDSLIQNFMVFGPQKSNLRRFLNNLDVTQTLQELYRKDLSELDKTHFDLLRKYLDPFPKKIHIERMPNTVPALSEFLFRQQDPRLVEVFNLPLAATEPSLKDIIRSHRSSCHLLSALNPLGFVHYFVARFDDFFMDAATANKFTDKWLELYVVPKFLVIQTLYPLTDVLTRALEYCVAAHRRTKLNTFVSLVADNKTTPKDFETLDAEALPLLSLAPVVAILRALEAQRPTLATPFSLPLGDRILKATLPGLKEAAAAEVGVALAKVLRDTCFEEIFLILGSLVAERTVVFISKSQRKISRILAAFNAILSPLSWVYPLVYALPRECLQILAAPVPVVAGVLAEPAAFIRDYEIRVELPGAKSSPFQNTLFYFLDQGVFRACAKLVASTPVPLDIDLVRAMDRLYRDNFNPKASKYVKIETSKSKSIAKLTPRSALSKSEAAAFEPGPRTSKTQLKSDAVSKANELLEMFRRLWEHYLSSPEVNPKDTDAFGTTLKTSQAFSYHLQEKDASGHPARS